MTGLTEAAMEEIITPRNEEMDMVYREFAGMEEVASFEEYEEHNGGENDE